MATTLIEHMEGQRIDVSSAQLVPLASFLSLGTLRAAIIE
jgi:hypothetical protein